LILPANFRPQHAFHFAEAFEFLSIKSRCIHGLPSCPKKISSCVTGYTKRPPRNEMLTHDSAEESAAKIKN